MLQLPEEVLLISGVLNLQALLWEVPPVTHGYTYDQANVVTGADISEDRICCCTF